MTPIPAVGNEIKTQPDFMTLLVLSVRDITVVGRLQHQNTPKTHTLTHTHTHTHTHRACELLFPCQHTHEAKYAKTLLSNITISKGEWRTLRPMATEHRKRGRGIIFTSSKNSSYILRSKVRLYHLTLFWWFQMSSNELETNTQTDNI